MRIHCSKLGREWFTYDPEVKRFRRQLAGELEVPRTLQKKSLPRRALAPYLHDLAVSIPSNYLPFEAGSGANR